MSSFQRLLKGLRPTSWFDWWTVAVFLGAVLRLFLLRDLEGRVLFLFLVPPVFAFLFKHRSSRRSTRIVAVSFLTVVSLGEGLSYLPELFPQMGGVDRRLPPSQDRLLTWYVVVYLLYLFLVVPLFLFVRALVDRARQQPAEFTRFTCVLGLIACAVVGPLMVRVCCVVLHLLPVVSR